MIESIVWDHFPNCPLDPLGGLFLCYNYEVIEQRQMTKVLEFAESSAIAKISLDTENSEVGVAFTSNPDNFYFFECDDVEDFEESVNVVIENDDSLGRFIALARKDGTLAAV